MSHPPRSLRLAFAGTPQFAVPALDALAASRHRLTAVFTQADRPAGRGRELQASSVKQRAAELQLAVHQPLSFRDPAALELLGELDLDAFVVVAYGQILPPAALALPRLGCLNIHASLLPRWRGAAPIQRAILAGDALTGVTVMRMEAGLDTGPILDTAAVAIGPAETALELGTRLAHLGAARIVAVLDRLAAVDAADAVAAVRQSDAEVTYAAKITKAEALIDWEESAAAIVRRVHAFNPRPVAETRFRAAQLRIWDAAAVTLDSAGVPPGTVIGVSHDGIDVASGAGVVRLTRVQAPGKKPLEAFRYAQSQPLAGARLGVP